ncbi:4,5-dihydroxyphthalate decarboxylase [Streptomyces morookaense]|uniref:4,5-dihydroxyphthalate decarboxylase n=1 Tax=Streptomyces morookaense TaxID=1970 RepID=A0A7Y7BAC9_STRMO|nr:4,5-dihydroxyphthalate decarboxylase [Streptomyces morookaense]NVK81491.1 4,5-dihydroxyphthalate decarboxylase [Streptomyces morookaense]GHF24379.1 4,5-dihydroxyphthalate decarboxylase [Streptomyces morookaense]
MGTRLSVGVHAYEHTQALFDGRVAVDGVDAVFETAPLVSDIFRRAVEGRYDLAEFGLTYFLRTFDLGDAPFLALPIVPNRNFRHSAIFVNASCGIEKPQDLAGRTIGEFALYGHDAGIWPKGILADEYGVTPDQCRWVIGGTNHPLPAFDWVPQPVPDGVDVRHAEDGRTLGAMLESGEIDALISVDVPQAVLNGSQKVARLFPDYEAVERAYYRRTGIFPPMHIVVIRRELARRQGLARAVYDAFMRAKDLAEQKYLDDAAKQHMSVITPWFSALFEENRRLLGDDWWPYGVGANRKAIDTFLRYHHEQGLSKRRLTCEDIFVPELLDT